jgi:hypothetical protein
MSTSHPPRIRKRLLVSDSLPPDSTGALDLSASASFEYTSEDPEHCVENILDDHRGPGGTYWSGARIDSIERLVIAFDAPQILSRLVYEVEESQWKRTQEVRIELSEDSRRTYRTVLNQQYTFSPRGATFQREDIRLQASTVTHLRLTVIPNKGGTGKATLVSLLLYP